mmetsp:Transcript_18550/g.74554  ORF Transcript_18550/g.74554 Transcript_18550/m.74554 type:complete len:98 (+) Transcript_18550:2522-2815(+)
MRTNKRSFGQSSGLSRYKFSFWVAGHHLLRDLTKILLFLLEQNQRITLVSSKGLQNSLKMLLLGLVVHYSPSVYLRGSRTQSTRILEQMSIVDPDPA